MSTRTAIAPAPYRSQVAIPPGETIQELLETHGMTQKELADRMGRPAPTVSQIIRGHKAITPETALQLDRVFGLSYQFWINLEANYRATKERLSEGRRTPDPAGELRAIPYAVLRKLRVVPETRSPREQAVNKLRFLGVASCEAVKRTYGDFHAAARRGRGTTINPFRLAAWVRLGELNAQYLEPTEYQRDKMFELLPELRSLVREPRVEQAWETFVACCRSEGLVVAAVPELPSLGVNGVTFWRRKTPFVFVNIRGKYHDIFWFTVFHELAHVLLHRDREIIVDLSRQPKTTSIEREADRFAADLLVPAEAYREFVSGTTRFSLESIRRFAESIDTHPGVVVGRLHHDNRLPPSDGNGLRAKLRWRLQAAAC